MDFTYIKSFFKPVFYIEVNGVDFYIRRKLYKRIISMRNIKIYDRSGRDNHEWEFIDFFYTRDEPFIDGIIYFIENQRPEFFDYKIKGYK